MKLFNREKRIEVLGFDDKWFMIIGIPGLALIIDFIFNNSFARHPLKYALINYSISLFFSIFNWTIFRSIMIYFRKRFPSIKDGLLRISIVLGVCFLTVYIVDKAGNIILKAAFGDSYNGLTNLRMLVPILLITIMIISIYEAIYFYVHLKKSIRDQEQAKQAVVQAQLDALRNQSQPHFLFNSFNTLRDIIDSETKEDAKNFVDQLSNVYRFILESGNSNMIQLADETKFSKAYIYIQKERFRDNLNVDWKLNPDGEHHLIVPMSIQLLLENAIKHNVVSKNKPLTIIVESTNNEIIVKNKIASKSTKLPSTGLGLKNIEKRYDLLSNKNIHIEHNNETFKVTIPLLKSSDQKIQHAYTNN